MIPQWIIERKRDGEVLAPEVIRDFVAAYARGDVPDYQMAAFAMAVYFKGMSFEETTALTDAMMRSGEVLEWSGLSRPTADKHSTGGIGDKISIPLAPLVAACGVAVPMISGRGLGITGGTLDKLESIPGYETNISTERFRAILEKVGCSIIGQTERLAPADRKLYALRDVTGTVPSIPLISASIMSKKLAEGAGALVLDVKCGEGAFMKTRDDARKLAETMIAIGTGMGRKMSALITAMDQPLGRTAGNALEIAESIAVLKGEGPEDVRELVLALGERMLALARQHSVISNQYSVISNTDYRLPITDYRQELEQCLASGKALERFTAMVEAHGGNPRVVDDVGLLPKAGVVAEVVAPCEGTVCRVSADAIGRVVLMLGGGRTKTVDAIDYGVGISHLVKVGERVEKGDVLMKIHAKSTADVETVKAMAMGAVEFGESVDDTPLVYEVM